MGTSLLHHRHSFEQIISLLLDVTNSVYNHFLGGGLSLKSPVLAQIRYRIFVRLMVLAVRVTESVAQRRHALQHLIVRLDARQASMGHRHGSMCIDVGAFADQ